MIKTTPTTPTTVQKQTMPLEAIPYGWMVYASDTIPVIYLDRDVAMMVVKEADYSATIDTDATSATSIVYSNGWVIKATPLVTRAIWEQRDRFKIERAMIDEKMSDAFIQSKMLGILVND